MRLLRAAPLDWLVVGLGNPGREYEGSRHNIGFAVLDELVRRWELGRPRKRFRSLVWEGRRIALLSPQTFYNDCGRAVGPARGHYRIELDRLLVVHDEIDLPFGEIRVREGGGLAGNNGLKSLRAALGSADFVRVRVGVGRPASTDPDRVAAYVLGRFRESPQEVAELVAGAADEVAQTVSGV